MTTRVFIVHRWGGLATDNWYQWLKTELEKENIEVYIPQMPETDTPHIATWVPALARVVGSPDERTFFVGHSMGNQTIARYLETLPDDLKIGGVVFVAPFMKRLTNLEPDVETQTIANEWLTTPLDLTKVRSHLTKSTAIFSDNDQYVPIDNQDDFLNKLDSKIVLEHNLGHMSPSDGILKVESIKESILGLI